ncbi:MULTISPECIES: hypothetical protein [unclassified Flavobacterium]|jgi:hypothetical protein|uniref:hypothetical protein n=1 Tax=unclassified Flavobacterium TaxID=196869 RepID=UPI0025C72695|nr:MULTISPECIES: hypothetical protein [unclassified Flavobacterium]
MITFTIIAIVVIIIIKFLMYSSKPENQIEANDIRKKFKPFIDTIINSYMQNNVSCSVEDIDDDKRCVVIQTDKLSINDDKITHFIYFMNDSFKIEIIYKIFSLKFNKIYTYKVSEMDGQRQINEAKDILRNFTHLKLQFEKDNEVTIIEEIIDKNLYN